MEHLQRISCVYFCGTYNMRNIILNSLTFNSIKASMQRSVWGFHLFPK